MFAHNSMSLVVVALVLGSVCASEAPAAPAAAAADASGFLAAKPKVFAVNPAADSANAFSGVPAESFGGAKDAAPVPVSDGSAYGAMPAAPGAMASAGAMPAAPGEGGSGGVSTVLTAVGVTVLVMSLCSCAMVYCCCKECWTLSGASEVANSGDYDMANLGEAAAAGAAAEHFIS